MGWRAEDSANGRPVYPTPVCLAAIVAVSACLRFVSARTAPIPWLMPDELIYAGLGRKLADGTVTSSLWAYGPVYPLLIAPFERVLSPQRAFEAIQLFNACAFSLAALPSFALARRVLSSNRAVVAAGLVLLVPGGFYTSRAMTESVAYPLALCALLAIVRTVERPTLRAQALAVAIIGLTACVRIELLGLALVFAVTVFAVALADRRAQPGRSLSGLLRPYRTLGTLGIAGAALLGVVAIRGAVGASHGFSTGRLSAGRLAESIVSHLALLDLGVGVAPLAACILLLSGARRQDFDRSVLTLSIAGAATAAVLCSISAAYLTSLPHTAADPPLRIFDRYTFYAFPALLIGLLVWLERRDVWPRRRAVALVSIACVAFVAAVPFDRLLTGREWGASTSSIALLPIVFVHDLAPGSYVPLIAALVLAAALTVSLVVRAPEDWPALHIAAFFIVSGMLAAWFGHVLSARVEAVSATSAWVERSAPPADRIPLLWIDTGKANEEYGLWETELGNRDVGPVYDVGAPLADRFDELPLGSRTLTGYVIAPRPVRLGPVVAVDPAAGLALYRLVRPLTATRLRALVSIDLDHLRRAKVPDFEAAY